MSIVQTATAPSTLRVLYTEMLPIFQQLQIEEALLRTSSDDWVVINRGSVTPSVVLGISAQPHDVINSSCFETSPIPILRRFSGGGTVVVDKHTLFFSLICNKSSLCADIHNPKSLMHWVYTLLFPAFHPHNFALEENDFAIDKKKIGGNAQCFTKDRILHHTSFLWDWSEERMDLLAFPKIVPAYRKDRKHSQFCGKLSQYWASMGDIADNILTALTLRYQIIEILYEPTSLTQLIHRPHRKALEKIVC